MDCKDKSVDYEWLLKSVFYHSSNSLNILSFILDFLCIISIGRLDYAISQREMRKEYLLLLKDYAIYTHKGSDLYLNRLEEFYWWSYTRDIYVNKYFMRRIRSFTPNPTILYNYIFS